MKIFDETNLTKNALHNTCFALREVIKSPEGDEYLRLSDCATLDNTKKWFERKLFFYIRKMLVAKGFFKTGFSDYCNYMFNEKNGLGLINVS